MERKSNSPTRTRFPCHVTNKQNFPISEHRMNQKKKPNQYDAFLHLIQQTKMKELWDNLEDEEWEKA